MKQKIKIQHLFSALAFVVVITFVPACATQSGLASRSNQTGPATGQTNTVSASTDETGLADDLGRFAGW